MPYFVRHQTAKIGAGGYTAQDGECRRMNQLPSETTMGPVRLRVADMDRAFGFYRDVLGLQPQPQASNDDTVTLHDLDGRALLVLSAAPNARPRPPRSTGLYHFAILVPDRASLGATLRRLLDTRYPLQGASDHGVSEALYLADPDGNGIEIYRDRPRAEWPFEDGELSMVTESLDAEGVLAESRGAWEGLPRGTRMGHIHLQVRDLAEAEDFYTRTLGLDLMQRYPPATQARGRASAAFLSAGGYHHHVGINTWTSAGAPPPPPGAVGLQHFTLLLPDTDALVAARARLEATGIPVEPQDAGFLVRDPSGNAVRLEVGS